MTSMIDATNSSTAASSASAFGLTGAEKSMNRDDFLKLLVAQLKNQDPLKPQDNTEFVAQLAQFSSLEATMGINDRLDMLTLQSRGQSNTEAISMVGKTVTVRGSNLTSDGSGTAVPIRFTQDAASASTTVTIRDQSGSTVRIMDLGAQKAGIVSKNWDGRNNNGLIQPAGSYSMTVTAKDANDAAISVTQQASGTVDSVSFDQGYPVLHLTNGLSVPVSDLVKVGSP
jgi:flagellar basal-body rod modification protein FlgD